MKKQRKWYPISEIFTIGKQINDLLEDTENQQKIFSKVKASPSSMNNELIQRAANLFTKRKGAINLYADQVNKWENEAMTSSDEEEVTRLQNILTNIEKNNQGTLSIVKYISQYTIEKILSMDETELAVKTMSGEIPLPKNIR